MSNDDKLTEFVSLSSQLDFALAMEEYHRDRLLYWLQRRHELEQEITFPIDELSQIAEDCFNVIDNTAYQGRY